MLKINKIEKTKVALGYARISTNEDMQKHSLHAQSEDIKKYCELYGLKLKKIETEKKSGTKMDKREKLQKILNNNNFDVIITTKIDRLARNIVDLNKIVYSLKERGKDVVFIENNIDTTSANGRLFLNILGAFAEFEAEIISERVKRGMLEAKKRGVKLGRKPKKETLLKIEIQTIRSLRQRKKLTYKEISKRLGYANGSVIRNKLKNYLKTKEHKDAVINKNLKISQSLKKQKTSKYVKGLI